MKPIFKIILLHLSYLLNKTLNGKLIHIWLLNLQSQALQPDLKTLQVHEGFHIHILFFSKAKAEKRVKSSGFTLHTYTNINPNTDREVMRDLN